MSLFSQVRRLLACCFILIFAGSQFAYTQMGERAGYGMIAFESNRDETDPYRFMYSGVDILSDGVRTRFAQNAFAPSWSNDGTKLAVSTFNINPNEGRPVYFDFTTGEVYSLPTDTIRPVAWSADGTRIVVVSSGGKNIYTARLDGTDRKLVVGNLPCAVSLVRWSRNGAKIGYQLNCQYTDQAAAGGIYLVNSDGSGSPFKVPLGNCPDNIRANPNNFTISPNATKLAYHAGSGAGTQGLCITNDDGGGGIHTWGLFPEWSPNGAAILHNTGGGGDPFEGGIELYFPADGSRQVLLGQYQRAERVSGQPLPTVPLVGVVQFSQPDYGSLSGGGWREGNTYYLNVHRFGDVSTAATVEYATQDGTAWAGADFSEAKGTLYFAPGQAAATISVRLINDYVYERPYERFNVVLSNPTGNLHFNPLAGTSATIAIEDSLAIPSFNPIDDVDYFIEAHYQDFLGRYAERDGFFSWRGVFAQCRDDRQCLENARISVSASFFRSQEFQQKGFYIYRFYKAAFGRRPTYVEYNADMQPFYNKTAAQVQARRDAFPEEFAARSEFKAKYDALSNADFVNELLRTAGVEVSRAGFIADLDARSKTRPQVLREVVESRELAAKDYNEAFVTMQYFGYLRRDPEQSGFDAWLRVLERNPSDYRTMVKGFVNSIEYRKRFGTP